MELPKRIILASDHAGFSLKEAIKQHLIDQGIDIIDVQPLLEEDDDYPAVIRKGCSAALEQECLAIVFGGSGNGEAIAANKVHGIRCALVYSEETAQLARAHNDANVMSLGARLTDEELAKKCVNTFLSTEFEEGRHVSRVNDLEVEG